LLVIVAPASSSRLAAVAAAAAAALAALLSCGTLAFTGAGSAALAADARLGLVPHDAWHVALAIAAGLVVLAIGWRSDPDRGPVPILAAASPLVLVFLPWLPFGVPRAFLAWTGGVLSLVWIATALGLARVVWGRRHATLFAPPRPVLFVGIVSFVLFAAAAWFASPSIPGGDEPHYLVITQSLLYDGDLKIENNHQRGDYRAYFPGDLSPDSIKRGRNGAVYSIHAPGLPAIVLPAFAIGGYRGVVVFLLLVAASACALAWWLAWRVTGSLAAAWFGWATVAIAAPWLLETFTVYPDGLGAAIVLTGFWGLLRAQWESDRGQTGARAVPEEGQTGARAVPERGQTGARPVSERGQTRVRPPSDPGLTLAGLRFDPGLTPWLLHGVALSVLPWMHTRFAVLAATLGGLILVRLAHVPKAMVKAIAFLLPPAISAVAWMFFFAVIYGTPDPSAPYGGRVDNSFAFLPNGLGGLLFDQGFGLLATAPALVFAFAGFTRIRRLALEWLVVAFPYLLAVTTFAMWWAGMSGPARFLVPLLLPLAIPAAAAWTAASSRGLRAVMLAALVVTTWLAAVMAGAGGGRLGYHTRNDGGMTAAPWMDWATRVVELPAAAPAFVPLPVGTPLAARVTAAQAGFAATLPWIFCLGGAGFAVARTIDRRRLSGERSIALTTLAFAAAAMAAGSIVWRMQPSPASRVAAQLDALRVLAASRVAAFDLTHHRRVSAPDAWGMALEIPIPLRAGRGGPRPLNRPLAVFPAVPAGSYLLQVRRRGSLNNDGWLMAGVGNDQFAIVTQPIAAFDGGVRLDLPVDVRAINVRSDEGARDQLEAVTLRPIARAPVRLAEDIARRAVRYGGSVVYFLDDRAFPEPSGFWIGGARDATFVVRDDQTRQAVPLILKNGAADNRALLEAGAWRSDVALRAGEERRVEVPVDPAVGAASIRIRSESGFRPSDLDGRNKDTRFLGVFVRIE
jgi:hypothetical protein